MRTVITRYLSATDNHGSRISCDDGVGNVLAYGYDHGAADAHIAAFTAYAIDFGLSGEFIMGYGPAGMRVFVRASNERVTVGGVS